MRIQVLFFGQLKDAVGRSTDEIDLPAGSSVGTVFEYYASQYPKLREMAASIAIARNHEFAGRGVALADGDEVALMPPVSGGSDADVEWIVCTTDDVGFYAVTDNPIDSRALVQILQADDDGAVIIFEGVVRNHTGSRKTLYLDYEGYPPLAVKTMQQIGRELRGKHDIHRVGIIHRIGRLELQEASVSIVVTSAHRQAAYDASLEAINRLKKLAPIWKKEHFEDGEVWVEGSWDEGVPMPGAPE
ncbi:MAG: molybdenum cofactor biosynthesis protein MoaE [Acidobacteria bacterium]|nr:molybdenum cofactor biosynthesis protein MoaE [Acidobacteriota bacterium]MDA1236179.1 molybdenum cofactor biosynthesis protein MoaE [Acidobacteriota bacterium]